MQRFFSFHSGAFRLMAMAVALGAFVIAPAGADDLPEEGPSLPQNAEQEVQEQVDQQESQIDQQLENQQDQVDQQLDQADEQIDQQQDAIDQQLDERTDQAEEQADELNQQLDQAEDQVDQRLDEAEGQLDADAEAEGQLDAEAEGQLDAAGAQDDRIRLGVAIDQNAQASEGLTIGEVMQGSLAADAGLRRGDVILSIDGQTFTSVDDLDRFMQQRRAGDSAEIIVLRDGQRHPMNITFRQTQFQGQGQFGPQYGQQQFANHGWLGITLDDGGQDPFGPQQTEGAVVATVYPGSPAADAGIQAGDRIVEVNGQRVTSVNFLLERLQQTNPGDRVDLVVFAGGNERNLTATLADSSVFDVASHQSSYGPDFEYGGFETFNTQSQGYDELVDMHRRMEEQHQRVEQMLNQMQQDIAEIRRQLDRHAQQGAPAPGQDADVQYSDETTADPDYQPEEAPRGSLPPIGEERGRDRETGNPPNPQ